MIKQAFYILVHMSNSKETGIDIQNGMMYY